MIRAGARPEASRSRSRRPDSSTAGPSARRDRPRRSISTPVPVRVTMPSRPLPLTDRAIRRLVRAVLAAERRAGRLAGGIEVTFLTPGAMRRLNREWKRHDRPTDVLAFTLALPGKRGAGAGDVYICPAVARREAAERGIPFREELARLVVHGTLHLLGYDHPEGPDRTASAMWRRQERYVKGLA